MELGEIQGSKEPCKHRTEFKRERLRLITGNLAMTNGPLFVFISRRFILTKASQRSPDTGEVTLSSSFFFLQRQPAFPPIAFAEKHAWQNGLGWPWNRKKGCREILSWVRLLWNEISRDSIDTHTWNYLPLRLSCRSRQTKCHCHGNWESSIQIRLWHKHSPGF